MAVDPLDMAKLTEGNLWCHRTQPMLVPRELQRLELVRLACIREKCTLWNNAFGCCSDVNNAVELTSIRQKLQVLIEHLPPELP